MRPGRLVPAVPPNSKLILSSLGLGKMKFAEKA
jgi:hypothetical protein